MLVVKFTNNNAINVELLNPLDAMNNQRKEDDRIGFIESNK